MIIDSKPWSIGDLLEGKYFHIPRYQRPYSWERSHLDEFWQDVIQDRGNEEYFIGSIVTAKPRSAQVYAVVDGQQRLTTITILLCALRDAFDKLGESDLANGTHIFIERRNRENKLQFVLTTESSYPFLQEHVQKQGTAELPGKAGPEEQAIEAAKDFFTSKLNDIVEAIRSDTSLNETKRSKELTKRLRAVRQQVISLKVIFIELESEDDAYLVFETLNTRGKDLRVADLVKNLVLRLKQPTNSGVDVAKDKWNKILETLEESEAGIRADAFLHHSWLSRNEFVAQKKLFKKVKEQVSRNNVDSYLNNCVRDATLYRVLYEPEFRPKKWQMQEFGIRDALRAIDQFGIRLSVPLILALLREWEDGALRLPMVRETLVALESFHFIFNAVTEQRATGGLAMMFASLASELSRANAADKNNKCVEIRQKLKARIPDFATFELAFSKIVYTKTQTKQKNLVKYILSKIAQHKNWAIDPKESTIEHFQPQSSSLEDSTVGQIGNLLLIPPKLNNDILRDKDFALKRTLLKKHQYPVPDAMKTAGSWGKEEIVAHTKELAELSYSRIWKLK